MELELSTGDVRVAKADLGVSAEHGSAIAQPEQAASRKMRRDPESFIQFIQGEMVECLIRTENRLVRASVL
jgi:hypothetical protein